MKYITDSQRWRLYSQPPAYCAGSVGKEFVMQNDKSIAARVLEYHFGVGYIPIRATPSGKYDVPMTNCPDFIIEMLSGPYQGQTFSIGANLFFEQFEPKV